MISSVSTERNCEHTKTREPRWRNDNEARVTVISILERRVTVSGPTLWLTTNYSQMEVPWQEEEWERSAPPYKEGRERTRPVCSCSWTVISPLTTVDSRRNTEEIRNNGKMTKRFNGLSSSVLLWHHTIQTYLNLVNWSHIGQTDHRRHSRTVPTSSRIPVFL